MGTAKQRKLAELRVANPTASNEELVKQTHSVSTARHAANRMINAKGTQDEIQRILTKAGISDGLVARRLKEALSYKKVQRIKLGSAKEGNETIETFVDIDNAGRLSAVETAAKLKGWLKDEQDAQKVYVLIVAQLVPLIAPFVIPEKRGELMATLEDVSGSVEPQTA